MKASDPSKILSADAGGQSAEQLLGGMMLLLLVTLFAAGAYVRGVWLEHQLLGSAQVQANHSAAGMHGR
jgi:hypothetical protein